MLFYLVLTSTLLLAANAQDFLCTSSFCEEDIVTTPCIAVPEGCNKTYDGIIFSGRFFPSPRVCSCCDYCLATLNEGDSCIVGVPGQVTPRSICGDSLTCSSDTESCQKISDTACAEDQQEYDDQQNEGQLGIAQWRPLCDEKGDFGTVRCIPGSICYCIEPERGERIFGEALYTSEAAAKRMTCGCGMAAWRATNISSGVQVAHCLADGSFDHLQCVGNNCTCVSSVDATLVGGNIVDLRELKAGHPTCFDPSLHTPGIYERWCEKERLRLVTEKEEMEEEGFTVLNVLLPECTPDGKYARTQTTKERSRICVDPDGQQIDKYGTSCGDSDCHCARTRWLLQQAGIVELPVCCSDGTFRRWQCWRGTCYCVDSMGNQNSTDVKPRDVPLLDCYSATGCPANECTGY